MGNGRPLSLGEASAPGTAMQPSWSARSSGPLRVASSPAAVGSFPTSRFARIRERWSMAPETGIPSRCAPYRPRSCTVVRSPGSTTDKAPVSRGSATFFDLFELFLRDRRKADMVTRPQEDQWVTCRVIQTKRRATHDVKPSRTLNRVDHTLITSDPNAARGNASPRTLEARNSQTPRKPAQVRKSRREPDEVDQVVTVRMQADDLFDGQRMALRHGIEIKSEFATVANRDGDPAARQRVTRTKLSDEPRERSDEIIHADKKRIVRDKQCAIRR